MSNIGTGYFLTFTAKQDAALREFLNNLEYPADKEGLLQFILDEVEGNDLDEDEPHNKFVRATKKALKDNPAIKVAAVELGKSLLGRILKSRI